MNLDHPSILRYRGDGGSGGSGAARAGIGGRISGNISSSSIMTNRPSSRSSSRASNNPNNLQSVRQGGNLPTGVSPRKLSRTLSGSGHLTRNLSSAGNIPSLSGNISSNLSGNFGGNLSGNLAGGNLSNTSTAGSGDEELDLDELLRLNIPHSRRNVDRSVEELCGGRESFSSGGGGGGSRGCGVGMGDSNKMNKMETISTITGRLTPMNESATNPYKTCKLPNASSKANHGMSSSYSSKTNINHQGHYASSSNINNNPYASNTNINNSSYASNPNIEHNPYASNLSINCGTNNNPYTSNGGGSNNNPYSSSGGGGKAGSGSNGHGMGRSSGSRRGILQRSDTAPEELVLERKLERKMVSAEWRRKRSFNRASSAERPSSVTTHARGSSSHYGIAHAADYAGSCSASCPPTVPTTPTRSPRSPRPQLRPPPPPGQGGGGRGEGGGLWSPSSTLDLFCAPCSRGGRHPSRGGKSWSSSLDLAPGPHQLSSSTLLQEGPPLHETLGSLALGASRLDMTQDLLRHSNPPPPTLWDCLVSCHHSMEQRLARKRVEQGVKLYNEQKHVAAVRKWKQALQRIGKASDRFITLGYLATAHYDWGRYREMVDLGFQQLDIANELKSPTLRSEAYLSLARSNERMGNCDKAITYCRHSLYNQCDQSKTTGNVHLTLGSIYTCFSSFSKALEHYELALKVARAIKEPALELQVYCGLATVFCLLQDYEKAVSFSAKAFELSKNFPALELSSKYQRMSLLCLVTPLRKLGRLHEAKECCQDAVKLAMTAGDRNAHGRCLVLLADLHRTCRDVQKAYKRYQASLVMFMHLEDKYGQLLSLNGVAKTLMLMRSQNKICDCKPIEINNKVIDVAQGIGCKLLMRSAHQRLSEIYHILEDADQQSLQRRLAACLTEEMELMCGVCREHYGNTPSNSLDALPCSHIFHAKCVRDLMSTGDRKKKKRLCPDCRKSLNSKLMILGYDDLRANCSASGGGGYRDRESLGLGSDCSKGLLYQSGDDEFDDEVEHDEDDEENAQDNGEDEEDEDECGYGSGNGGGDCPGMSFGGGTGARGGLGGSFGGSGRLPILSGSSSRLEAYGGLSGNAAGGLSGSRALSGSLGLYGGQGLTRGLSISEGLVGIGVGSSSHIQLMGRTGTRSGEGIGGGLTRGLSSSGGIGEGELSSLDVIGGRPHGSSGVPSRSASTSYENRYHRTTSPQRIHDQRL